MDGEPTILFAMRDVGCALAYSSLSGSTSKADDSNMAPKRSSPRGLVLDILSVTVSCQAFVSFGRGKVDKEHTGEMLDDIPVLLLLKTKVAPYVRPRKPSGDCCDRGVFV